MGDWGYKPWNNDWAADWYGPLIDKTDLRTKVRVTLESDVNENDAQIRAAASLLLFLGRIYIWPIDHLDDDLTLAIKQLKKIKVLMDDDGLPEYVTEIENEIALLECRLDKDRKLPESQEFNNWCVSLLK